MDKAKGNIDAREEQLVEKTVSQETTFEGKVFQVVVRDVELYDGSHARREVVLHNGGAAVVALDADNQVYLVRQFRSPYGQVIYEIPAGKLEKGEDPKVAALRELKEETGMEAGSIISLGEMYATPGYCSEILYLYLATDLKMGEGNPDDGEILRVLKMPLSRVVEMIEANEIMDAKTIAGILKTARKVGI